jgi:hypothetical protein
VLVTGWSSLFKGRVSIVRDLDPDNFLFAYTYRLVISSIVREIDTKFTIHDLVVIQIAYCGRGGV